MATVFTQAASPLKLNLHAPKPASRFDDLSFDPMDASPLPARGLAAAGCVQAMPPRRSTSSARAPLVCASLTSEATLHRRGRAPPRRGTKVILTDLRKHDDLNGEVGFIVFKPDDRFDGRPVPRPPARPPGHRLRQGIKPARRHVRTLRRAPLHPRARRSNSSLRPPRRPRRTVDDHPIQSLLDCFKQKLGLTASMCHSVLAQALSESMIQPARRALATGPYSPARPAPDGLPVSAGEPPCRKRREHHLPPLAPRKPVTGLPPPHREPSAQILDAASFDHESDSAVVELAKIPDEQALVRPNSNAAVVDASPLSFKNPVPDRCTAPGEPLPLEAHILPVKIKRKVSLLLDEGLLSWQDVLEVRQGDATPRPRRARSSPARGDVTRSGRQRLLGDCVHRHPRLAGAGAVVPGSSTPPSPVRWALAVSTPTSTLAARPLPPRALLRCALTLPSRSLRHAADRLQLLPAPRGARLPSRARASPHAPRRITPPGTPSRATLPSLPAAPPRPRALVHTLPPPAYACRRPVPSPRQWERLMLNPARLYPTARLQIVRDLFFREWQARAHRSHPLPTGAAAAASAADVKSTSGMRRTPRPFPNAVRPAIPTRHHSRPRTAARAASAASCTRCTSPTSRRRRARRWPSGRRRSPTTRRSAIGRHASRSLCPRTLPPVASQDDRPSTAHRAASPSPFANTHHIAVTIPAGPATTRASASAALAHSHDAVTATSPTAPSRLQPHARRREPTTAHLRRPTHLHHPT